MKKRFGESLLGSQPVKSFNHKNAQPAMGVRYRRCATHRAVHSGRESYLGVPERSPRPLRQWHWQWPRGRLENDDSSSHGLANRVAMRVEV